MRYEMRRKDRQLAGDEALRILREGEYGVLSTVGGDGAPYGVPLSYAFADGCIWFHSATEGRKVDNLVVSPLVSFCVVGPTRVLPGEFSTLYESAIVTGRARRCEGGEKLAGLLHLVEKYSAAYREKGQKYAEAALGKVNVYCLAIERVTAKARLKKAHAQALRR